MFKIRPHHGLTRDDVDVHIEIKLIFEFSVHEQWTMHPNGKQTKNTGFNSQIVLAAFGFERIVELICLVNLDCFFFQFYFGLFFRWTVPSILDIER